MQILYLIGNGFDVNLNMKTRYSDFYEYYQKIETENEVLKNLKKNIKDGVDTWADLEIRLGEYTQETKTPKEFMEIYNDLLEKFGDYLQDAEDNVDWESANIEKFIKHLCEPEKSLMQKDINVINNFKNEFSKDIWKVDIITYNYTRSIERLLAEKFTNLTLSSHHGTYHIFLKKVLHVHGELNNMVLGVNDILQIRNENFHNEPKILKAFIKEENNKRQGHAVDTNLSDRISKANLICIFGLSIGPTDKIWWEKIGQHLLNNKQCMLLIFTYQEIKNKRAIHLKNECEDELREVFMKHANLNKDQQEEINDRVFIRANTDMFSSLLNEKVLQ